MPRMNVTPENRAELEELAGRMADLGYPISLPPEHTGYDVWIVNEDGEQIEHVGFYPGEPPEGLHGAREDSTQPFPAEPPFSDVRTVLDRHRKLRAEQRRQFVVEEEWDDATGEFTGSRRAPYVSAVNRNGLRVELR